jgi:two-component system phosphate regulon response regulator PhoB
MTELELAERIKLEEDTLCSLPFESHYKMRRAELTSQVNLHRAMLVEIVCPQPGCSGQGEAGGDGHASSRGKVTYLDNDRPASQDSPASEESDEVRVLVLESEPIVALLLRLVLENRGYSVRDVGSGANALRECGRWAPDAIVADLSVAGAASIDFVAGLRAQVGAGGLPVIGTSPNSLQVPGIDALFARPFEAEEVAEKVACLISEKEGGRAERCMSETASPEVRRQSCVRSGVA